MKKTLNIIYYLGLGLVFAACSKNQEPAMSDAVHLMEQEAPKAKQAGPTMEWLIYCEGTCSECTGTGVKVKPTVYECACTENCALKVSRVQVGPGPGESHEPALVEAEEVLSLIAQYGTFQEKMERSLNQRYGIEDYRIQQVKVFKSTHSFVLQYFISPLDSEQIVSLSYVQEGSEPAYEVDCSGGCIEASARCTERVILGDPIQIECTCEGDCHMDISTVGPEHEIE